MKAVRSSYHVSIVPSLSLSNHVFASLEHFGSTIKLVSLDESQMVTFNGEFVCGFRNGDYGTESQSDNMIGSLHGFIIHWIVISKNIKEVTKIIDVENWRIDNSRVLRWIVSLFEWNSSVSLTKSLIHSTFRFRIGDMIVERYEVVETIDLSKPVTSNSVPTTKESKVMKNNKVITLGMFRINPSKTSREDKFVPINEARASIKTNPITVSQPHVITKKDVNSDSDGLSSTGVDNAVKTRRPQPMSNTKNDRYDSSKGDNACTFNRQEPTSKQFPNSTSLLGTARFGNDHIAVILGYDDLQWGNILITRVYFVEGLGHNLFSDGQFCDSVDDYSRYTWVHFLKSKDEAPEEIKIFLKKIQVLLQALVIIVRTDNSTEFKIQVLKEYFDDVGISHQTSYVKTPQKNKVVERRNRTSVEAAITMLIFFLVLRYFYGLKKLDISFLHVFGALCYAKNDRANIRKLGAKGDIGFFFGYSANSNAYRIYNRRTKKIMETMNVTFDELLAMAFEQRNSKPMLQRMTSGQINLQFEVMHDDYIGGQPSTTPRTAPTASAPQYEAVADNVQNAMFDGNTFVNPFAPPSKSSGKSSSQYPLRNVDDGEMTFFLGLQVNQSLRAIFINQYNYVFEILKKYEIETCDPIGTLMKTKDKLDLNKNRTLVDAMKYRSMIDALMYLRSSRPKIVHATCLCARYQAQPTEKHLKKVKRIFRYLWGTVNMGVWYKGLKTKQKR
nr:hypothetical protein [Tanacetum cinerariifolium]